MNEINFLTENDIVYFERLEKEGKAIIVRIDPKKLLSLDLKSLESRASYSLKEVQEWIKENEIYDITPFINVMNEWYAKDMSRKIRAVFDARTKAGLRVTASTIFGYKHLPDDKQKYYIDQETADIVRHIYELAANGATAAVIARTLTEEKILIPAAYHVQRYSNKYKYKDPFHWSDSTVMKILREQEYLGHTVLKKTVSKGFATKERLPAKEEERLLFQETHEAIIDQETWDRVNRILPKQNLSCDESHRHNRLQGFVFCADCGKRMFYLHKDKTGAGEKFLCNTPGKTHKKSYVIKAQLIEDTIHIIVKYVAEMILKDEVQFIEKYRAWWDEHHVRNTEYDMEKMDQIRKRIGDVGFIVRNLYEDKAKKLISERQFYHLLHQYDKEKDELETEMMALRHEMEDAILDMDTVYRFISLVKKQKEYSALTDDIFYSLVDHIVVHKPLGGRSFFRWQRIEVFFSYIGNFIPEELYISEEKHAESIEEVYTAKSYKAWRIAMEKRLDGLSELSDNNPLAAYEYDRLSALYDKKKKAHDERENKAKEYKKKWFAEFKENAQTDPDVKIRWEHRLEVKRKYQREHSDNKAAKQINPGNDSGAEGDDHE